MARCAFKARRLAKGAALATEARTRALQATARAVAAEADRMLATAGAGRDANPWYPLTARELRWPGWSPPAGPTARSRPGCSSPPRRSRPTSSTS